MEKKVQINEINIGMRLGYIEIDGSYIFVFHLVLIFMCLKKKEKKSSLEYNMSLPVEDSGVRCATFY